MVAALVVLLWAGALQLALGLYVRNVLVDAAGEGARHGALAKAGPADAESRTRQILAMSLDENYPATVRAGRVERDGVALLRVRVDAPLPVIGLLGPTGMLGADGHALVEGER